MDLLQVFVVVKVYFVPIIVFHLTAIAFVCIINRSCLFFTRLYIKINICHYYWLIHGIDARFSLSPAMLLDLSQFYNILQKKIISLNHSG